MALQIEEFLTFEHEVERLTEICGYSLPSLTEGPRGFFRSLPSWLTGRGAVNTSVLLPEPSLNLALPYARDELSLALGLSNEKAPENAVRDHAAAFGLDAELLDRPVSALSGGEQMLVSLCKTAAFVSRAHRVVLCSPYFWLDAQNRVRVRQVLDLLEAGSISSHLLLLTGEDRLTEEEKDVPVSSQSQLQWSLTLNNVSVKYPAALFPRYSNEKVIRFEISGRTVSLRSPTVLKGLNGVGKTTLAKLLTGIIKASEGTITAATAGFSGAARLQLQDPLLHFFAQSPLGHLQRVFRCSADKQKEAQTLFNKLQQDCAAALSRLLPSAAVGPRDKPSTILQAKLALAAERLVTSAPLLILDEPAWCLSRPFARAYLNAVANACHDRGTALLVISHQTDWWRGLVADSLQMTVFDGVVHVSAVGL